MNTQPKVLNYKNLNGQTGINVMRPSKFGNPYKLIHDGNRDEVCDKFENYVQSRPDLIAAAKIELKGQNLICCCAPLRCHALTLLRIANEINDNDYI